MKNITRLAEALKLLTYEDMMVVSEWFAGWTSSDHEGKEIEQTISREQMAALLNHWANDNLVNCPRSEDDG